MPQPLECGWGESSLQKCHAGLLFLFLSPPHSRFFGSHSLEIACGRSGRSQGCSQVSGFKASLRYRGLMNYARHS